MFLIYLVNISLKPPNAALTEFGGKNNHYIDEMNVFLNFELNT